MGIRGRRRGREQDSRGSSRSDTHSERPQEPTAHCAFSGPDLGAQWRSPRTEVRGLHWGVRAVSRILFSTQGGRRPFIWVRRCRRTRAAYPRFIEPDQLIAAYLALHAVGFTVPRLSPAARCALTAPFHPCLCPCGPSAVCFLWHFPYARRRHRTRWALPTTVSCRVRTFLDPKGRGRHTRTHKTIG